MNSGIHLDPGRVGNWQWTGATVRVAAILVCLVFWIWVITRFF